MQRAAHSSRTRSFPTTSSTPLRWRWPRRWPARPRSDFACRNWQPIDGSRTWAWAAGAVEESIQIQGLNRFPKSRIELSEWQYRLDLHGGGI